MGVFARHNESVVFASSGNASECRMSVADKRLGAMSHAQCGDSVKMWQYLLRVRCLLNESAAWTLRACGIEVCLRSGCGRRSAIDAWCDRGRCRRRLLVLPSRLCIFRRFGAFHKEQTNSKQENVRRNVSKMRHIIHIISKNVLYSASGGECFAKTFYASYKKFFGYVSRFL